MAKRYKGDHAGSRKDLEEALRLLKKVGDRAEIANTLNSLAEVALDQQDTDACEAFLEESLQLTRDLGNLRGLAFLFEAFAANAFFQKRPERCLRLFGAAAALREAIGAPLPDSDKARIEETIDLAGQALRRGNPEEIIAEGAALPLSTALEFAAGSAD
jgi:tetratricopeptide (TPR) repeat protein